MLTGVVVGTSLSHIENDLNLNQILMSHIIGGKLKTTAEADSESLQARWVRNIGDLQLRAKDIIPVIEKGTYALRLRTLVQRTSNGLLVY